MIIIKIMQIQVETGLVEKRILGKGAFGTVYQCYDNTDHCIYAVKVFNKNNMGQKKALMLRKEVEILKAIQHKNVVKFYDWFQTKSKLYIKMEYINHGTLRELLQKRWNKKEKFSDEEASQIIRSILQGLKYIHQCNIIHRDIKPQNLLVDDPNDFSTIKIADFGLSAKMETYNPSNAKAQCGTLLYMAPQMFFQPSYTKAVDLWSCAVIMYMLLNEGKHPFYQKHMNTHEYKNTIQCYDSFPSQNNFYANNFLNKISKRTYTERYSVNEAIRHPWITRNFDDQIPLSLHESYQGFDVAHKSTKLFRSLLIFRSLCLSEDSDKIPQQYKKMAFSFNAKNDQIRVRSPSRRKMNEKNQQLFSKMRSMLDSYQLSTKNIKQEKNPQQCFSPTIRRHDDMYSKNYDKKKGMLTLRMNSSQISCHIDHDITELQEQINLTKSQLMQKPSKQQGKECIKQYKIQQEQKAFKIQLPPLEMSPVFLKKSSKGYQNYNKIQLSLNKPKTIDIRQLNRERFPKRQFFELQKTQKRNQKSIDSQSRSMLKKTTNHRQAFSMRRTTNNMKRTRPMIFGMATKQTK